MQCPHCHHNGSRVVDSRPTDDGRVIRRRRECENCGFDLQRLNEWRLHYFCYQKEWNSRRIQ